MLKHSLSLFTIAMLETIFYLVDLVKCISPEWVSGLLKALLPTSEVVTAIVLFPPLAGYLFSSAEQ